MSVETLIELAVIFWLIVGMVFTLVAAIGLLKLNDPMTRLHAPTKAGTVGTGAFLMASMLYSLESGDPSMHEMLIMAFIFVTAPVSANFIARVSIHRRACTPPPLPPQDETWSTLDVPEEDREIVVS